MKKNLMSILILALLVVNIVLTAIMMFSVTGAMKSTTALVGRIAAVLDLELNLGDDETEVAIADSVTYDIADTMTIPLKRAVNEEGVEEDQRYAMIAVSILMDKTNKDYKEYAETMDANASVIKGEIIDVVSSYTLDEFRNDTDGVREAILARLRKVYNSDFIYKVVFSDWKIG